MSQQPDLRDEYIPFSHSAVSAVKQFHHGNYEKAQEHVDEMMEILKQKGG